jgi:sterol desaturase/sphingolipid hydroxylase (fatty acid hydroxylase superfamily)
MKIYKSLKLYAFLNIIYLLFGFIQYKSIILSHTTNLIQNCIIATIIYLIKNYFLIHFIDYISKSKMRINSNESNIPKENYKYEFHTYVVLNTIVESVSHTILLPKIINIEIVNNIYFDLLYFIPLSFVYEIIYDFLFYSMHRMLHSMCVYKYLHKLHHTFKHPNSITTYYQNPIDWLLATTIPTIMPLFILPYVSFFQFNLIIVYKTSLEIGGHCGKKIYPTGSFAQFPWLVKYLNIELYTEDHDLHHSLNNCNYGKRFSLWDKVFKTYKNGHEYYLKQIKN